jgi:hypothetical protein
MSVRAYTSRSRFDEQRRFTGVYQQMGRVSLDSDWNEEVRLRTVDARRRSADMADGSPDDGFRIVGDQLIDPITSLAGFAGQGLPSGDDRIIKPELGLDRHDPESLPWVVRSRGFVAVRRVLPAPVDLTAVPIGGGTAFAASALIFGVRFDRPPTDDEVVDVQLLLSDADGNEVAVPSGLPQRPVGWQELRVPVTSFTASPPAPASPPATPSIDLTQVTGWGVAGLPPTAVTWIEALRAEDPGLGGDVVIRGGDGTVTGSGRLFVDGVRLFLERDRRYTLQPDLPQPPALAALPNDGSRHHFFYLDVLEQTVTALDDDFLVEPALDGLDTTARLRLVSQVRALQSLADGDPEALPAPTGGGRLTTNVPQGALPDRVPPEATDPCRDRCLFTENVSIGDGYVGTDNLNLRVEIFRGGDQPVALWSRDNAATVLPLTAATAADSMTLQVAPADAARLRAGDIVVIEDRVTRLQPEGPRLPVLRRLRGVDTATGALDLEDARYVLTTTPTTLPAGGPVGRVFSPADGAAVRRWDGADLLVTGVRYRLPDGITFAFTAAGGAFRTGDYWTFTARVRAPDGSARGVVEQLTAAPVAGPVHHYVPLARVSAAADGTRVFEDLRRRFLPLGPVRDRLQELDNRVTGPGAFTVVVGDGMRSFGDVDQDIPEGVTGDEALQAALDLLGPAGGTIYIRSGRYKLAHPVLLRALSSLVILGDGDASELRVESAGGAFYLDRCGVAGKVELRDLNLVEAPFDAPGGGTIGLFPRPFAAADTAVRVLPVVDTRPLIVKLLGERFAPLPTPVERPLTLDDVRPPAVVADFITLTGQTLKTIGPGEGRAAASVVATLIQLRRLQRANPGTELAQVPAAQPLLAALGQLPQGVVTVADSHQVTISRCLLQSNGTGPAAAGVLVTGTCEEVAIENNRIYASAGVVAAPYAPYMAETFLVTFPRAGLFLSDLKIADNFIGARADGATGVHVADGVLSGLCIRDNRIDRFTVGVLVEDQAEGGAPHAVDRMLIAGNQVTGSIAVGIQIDGDGVDVADNEVRGAPASTGLFQAGIQVAGQGVRVRNCWVEVPSTAGVSPLGLVAGIVIGDGMDDGVTMPRPVFDVEVADNRVEGAGEDSQAIGVLVGGPQAIYDVRVRGNVIRNLGDAGVRVWACGGPVGRLRVEANRLERLALGDVPSQADVGAAITQLDGAVADALGANPPQTPRALLQALLGTSTVAVRAPLDGVLRWIERLSARGGVVLGNVQGGVVQGNRIAEIGRFTPFAAPGIDAEIRTAAVAVIAGADATIDGNDIEDVRAPVDAVTTPVTPPILRPPIFDVIQQIGIASNVTRVDRGDVHLAVVSMRSLLLDYAGADEARQQILSRSMFGPLDTVAQELQNLGGVTVALGATLVAEVNDIRTAESLDDHVARANIARATLSRAASATAADDTSQNAWDAAAQMDLAIVTGGDSLGKTATRLKGGLAPLTAGVDAAFSTPLGAALDALIATPTTPALALAVGTQLGLVASVRDVQAQRAKDATTGELFGPRRTIVQTFADTAITQLTGVTNDAAAANAPVIAQIKSSKDALVDQLSSVNQGLASDLEADFRDVDRTSGIVPSANARLQSTLSKIKDFAAGQTATTPVPAVTADDTARIAAQSFAAAVNLHSDNLDKQVGGLATQSDDDVELGLRTFSGMLTQLGALVQDDPDLAPLATSAQTSITNALAQPASRASLISDARSSLQQIKIKTADLLPVTSPVSDALAEPIDQRLAALGALVLTIRDLPPGPQLTEALDLFQSNLQRALDLAGIQGRARDLALAAVDDARSVLGGAAGAAPAAQSIERLATEVESVASTVVGSGTPPPSVDAAAVLLRALVQALDPDEQEAARLARVQSYISQRGSKLAASLVAALGAASSLDQLIAALGAALERLARGETPALAALLTPVIDRAPRPADGVFAAGVGTRLRVGRNHVQGAAAGITVLGPGGHVLADALAQDGLTAEIGGNRLDGCVVQALALSSETSTIAVVSDNTVVGSGGVAATGLSPLGHAVATFVGSGDLIVRHNLFEANGNANAGTRLHEMLLDWRGQIVVRGNTLRHTGGGAGGAGILIAAETVDPTLADKLTQAPFLATEPPPTLRLEGRPINTGIVPPLETSILGKLAAVPRAEDLLQLGGLKQRFTAVAPLNRALASPPAVAAAPTLAISTAARLFDTSRIVALRPPLIDFIIRPPIFLPPLPIPQAQRAVHVEGNDVEATGPSLLLLCDGSASSEAVVAATVVGNELRSLGGAGAAYIRFADSTVFSSNRCQCLGVVTVAVLRAGAAPVTATGNVVIGAEPVTPPAPPTPPPQPDGGSLTLHVPVGGGSTVAVPLSQEILLGSLERRKARASDAFSSLLTELATNPPATTPSTGTGGTTTGGTTTGGTTTGGTTTGGTTTGGTTGGGTVGGAGTGPGGPAEGGGGVIIDHGGPIFTGGNLPGTVFQPATPTLGGGGDPAAGNLVVTLPHTGDAPTADQLGNIKFTTDEVQSAFSNLVASGFAPSGDVSAANAQPTPAEIQAITDALNSSTVTSQPAAAAGAGTGMGAVSVAIPVSAVQPAAGTTSVPTVAIKTGAGSTINLSSGFIGSLSGTLIQNRIGAAGRAVVPGRLARPVRAATIATVPSGVFTTGVFTTGAGRTISTSILDDPTLGQLQTKLPSGVSTPLAATAIYASTPISEQSSVSALKQLVDTVSVHVPEDQDPTPQIKTALQIAGGDPKQALDVLDKTILGVSSAAPTVKASLTNVSVLHEVLADAFYGAGTPTRPIIDTPPPPPPLPPAPPASSRSLVIIGGTRVAAVANATTAGVHIQEADAVVELNP